MSQKSQVSEPDDAGKPSESAGKTPVSESAQLPDFRPPATTSPLQFNTQVNVTQLPPNALERLSPEQLMELHHSMMDRIDASDERNFKFAMDQIEREERTQRLGMRVGGLVSCVGYVVAGVLSYSGHETVAGVVAASLTTVLAMIVANRFLR